MDLGARLSFLFGTEEYVGMRRQLVLLREKMINHVHRMKNQNLYDICSGSRGEGVAFPSSDDDIMICQSNIRVLKTCMEVTQNGDVLMVPSEYSAGYCLLLDVMGSIQEDVIQVIQEVPVLSSSLVTQFYLQVMGKTFHLHGPCYSRTVGTDEVDYARCISCSTWPDVASEWLTKIRSYKWPSSQLIQNIVQGGCHLVPVGDPKSPYVQHEWRISFSLAERTLMHSFNHVQFLVYNLLRLTLKKIIEILFPGVLCSYFMKTTLFYTAEKTPIQLWQEKNLEVCFQACLSVLYDFVDQRYCPNYIIPDYNMFQRKINRANRYEILDMIRTIYPIGIKGILDLSRQSRYLNEPLSKEIMEYKQDIELMCSDHLFDARFDTERVFQTITQCTFDSLTSKFLTFCRLLLKCKQKNELINIIFRIGSNSCCMKMMDYLFTLTEINKKNYRQYKTIEALLRIGFRGDVTTGKLTMATYMYMVGKTESALYVLQQLLSEYPPYAIDGDAWRIQNYIYVMCGKRYSIDYKTRHSYVPDYSLCSQCMNAFPDSFRIWVSIIDSDFIKPLTYTFFLQTLCYIKLRNQTLLKKSTRHLVNIFYSQTNNVYERMTIKMCVGIIKYVQSDTQSACRWLGSVYIMANKLPAPYKEKWLSCVLTYLSCLLNKML